jgi:hypothetical protein
MLESDTPESGTTESDISDSDMSCMEFKLRCTAHTAHCTSTLHTLHSHFESRLVYSFKG